MDGGIKIGKLGGKVEKGMVRLIRQVFFNHYLLFHNISAFDHYLLFHNIGAIALFMSQTNEI